MSGSISSVGTQALEVASEHSDLFEMYVLTANNQADLLINQTRKYMPEVVVVVNERRYPELRGILEDLPIKVWAGTDTIAQMVQSEPIDMALTAMVGYPGLRLTIPTIKAGKTIALVNKETPVMAGELIMKLAAEREVPTLSVDSKHSVISQYSVGAYDSPIEEILLTASDGPFRRKTLEELATVMKTQALRHSSQTMGAKITVGSAPMMNKGFEMIEAKWLFGVTSDQVRVMVHPQSMIHSMMQFEDGAVIAQLGIPDMKLPIAYAPSFPTRMRSTAPRLDFNQYSTLAFGKSDMKRFHNSTFTFEAAHQGEDIPCILDTASEVMVVAFLRDHIGFLQMSDMVGRTMRETSFIVNPSYEDYAATDTKVRRSVAELF